MLIVSGHYGDQWILLVNISGCWWAINDISGHEYNNITLWGLFYKLWKMIFDDKGMVDDKGHLVVNDMSGHF